eukprot:2916359-Prymnesium_polylepis.1
MAGWSAAVRLPTPTARSASGNSRCSRLHVPTEAQSTSARSHGSADSSDTSTSSRRPQWLARSQPVTCERVYREKRSELKAGGTRSDLLRSVGSTPAGHVGGRVAAAVVQALRHAGPRR